MSDYRDPNSEQYPDGCGGCRFSKWHDWNAVAGGECRRHPKPYPEVTHTDWCGEYEEGTTDE